MKFANGDQYEGCWSEGLPHGEGTYTFKDGNKVRAEYEHGHQK